MPSWQFLGLKKETALVEVAQGFFRGGGMVILIGGLLSTMSALNATIYSSSRVSFAMGRDRNLPTWFGKVHPVRKTPHWAILASAVLIAIMAAALPIEAVASAADIMFLLLFIQVLVVLIVLRKKRPDLRRGFKVPFVPYVPMSGSFSSLAWRCAVLLQPDGLAERGRLDRPWLGRLLHLCAAAGSGLRTIGRGARGRRTQEISHPRLRRQPAAGGIVLDAAIAVAQRYEGELIALSVVEVPDRQLLQQGWNARSRPGTAWSTRWSPAQGWRASQDPGQNLTSDFLWHHRDGARGALQPHRDGAGAPRRPAGTLCGDIVDRVVRSAPAQVLTVTRGTLAAADEEDPLRLRARAALRIGGGPGGRLWPGGASRGCGRFKCCPARRRLPNCTRPRKRWPSPSANASRKAS